MPATQERPLSERSASALRSITELTGEREITVFRPNMRHLVDRGLVVKLRVKFPRFTRRLLLADLGLTGVGPDFVNASEQCQRLGNQSTLPKHALGPLKSLEERARQIIKDNGFEFPGYGYFIPLTSWQRVRAELQQRQEAFYAAADEMLDRLDELKTEQAGHFRVIARTIGERLIRLECSGQDLTAAQIEERIQIHVDNYVNEIMERVPTREYLRDMFEFGWSCQWPDVPESVASSYRIEELERQKAALDAQVAAATNLLNQTNEQLASDAQRQELEMRRRAVEEELQRQREADEEVRRTATTIRQREIEEMFSNVAIRLRELLYEAVTGVTEGVKRREGKSIHGKEIERLRNVAMQLRELNFAEDPEIKRMGDLLGELADVPLKERNVEEIVRQLDDVATIARADILELARVARTELENVPITPIEPARLRQARASIFLPDADEAWPIEAFDAPSVRPRRALD